MAKYRTGLPQLLGNVFLADGGMETTPVFHDGLELPEFAAFDLLKNEEKEAVGEVERIFARRINLTARKEYHIEQFDLQGG